MTHSLFSNGRRWSGKAFGMKQRGLGVNRFHNRVQSEPQVGKDSDTVNDDETFYDHSFDYSLETSQLSPEIVSLVLRYRNHESFATSGWKILLWKNMRDELRLIHCSNGDYVLLGWGCMAWSGGIWNASPFCLFRPAKVREYE